MLNFQYLHTFAARIDIIHALARYKDLDVDTRPYKGNKVFLEIITSLFYVSSLPLFPLLVTLSMMLTCG